jgi:hypothetical protein
MAYYKMKFYGSASGKISKKSYQFSKSEIIEAQAGDFDESTAEDISSDFEVEEAPERKEVKVVEEVAETAALSNKKRRRR